MAVSELFITSDLVANDVPRGLKHVLLAAERGFETAMGAAAAIYMEAGPQQSLAEALKWYERSGDAGNTRSYVMIGNIWLHGDMGEAQDLDRAYQWFDKAAEQGDLTGYFNHAMALFHGRHMDQDVPAAIHRMRELAAKDHGMSLHNLASYHRDGEHLPQDIEKAWDLFERAANQGMTASMLDLGDLCRDSAGERARPEDAMDWYHKAIEAGDADGWFSIGNAFKDGRAVEQDYLKAAEAFMEGAKADHDMCKVAFGCLYAEGLGVILDRPHAFALWTLVVQQGSDPEAIAEAERLLQLIAKEITQEELVQAAQNIRDWA